MRAIQVYVFGYKKDHFKNILQSGISPQQKGENKENIVKIAGYSQVTHRQVRN